jgi:hypothetical protein
MIEGKAALQLAQASMLREQRAQEQDSEPPGGFDRLLDSGDDARRGEALGVELQPGAEDSLETGIRRYLDTDASVPAEVTEELRQALLDSRFVEAAPEIVTERLGGLDAGSGWQELAFLLMGLFAHGRLDQRFTFGGSAVQAGGQQANVATATRAASQGQDAAPGNQRPVVAASQTQTAAVVAFGQFSRGADGWLSKTASTHANYERIAAQMLPPRENVLVLTDNGQKRIYVRNFFSPADVMDRLRELDELAQGRLAGAMLYINGNRAGSL